MYVFGYGSLVALDRLGAFLGRPVPAEDVRPARLSGYVRKWNVAMDNTRDVPGYKYYMDRGAGERPAIYVTFLNIVPREDASVNGVLVHIADEELSLFDRRERNYRRVEVTDRCEAGVAGLCFAYTGTDEAMVRYRSGAASGKSYVSRDYYDAVLQGFASLGSAAIEAFHATTVPPEAPLRNLDLRRVPAEEAEELPEATD